MEKIKIMFFHSLRGKLREQVRNQDGFSYRMVSLNS
jgi:hypothetical protein